MTTRYYEERPCPLCGIFETHAHGNQRWYGPLRRELTPDIDAAFQVMSGDVIDQLTEDEIREGRKLVAEAIDAALGRGDTRDE